LITDFRGKTAVLTGAGSGFGLECARIGARMGMNLVLADVQQDALDKAAAELRATGAAVLAEKLDVSDAVAYETFAQKAQAHFGAPHLVFNNAGVGAGGLVWENSLKDWQWVLGVNVMGVVHGVKFFTPMMLAAAKADPAWCGHIVNTASMAGVLNPPNMGVYNVSKHAVVSLSETLYHDLRLVTDQISASVLCPFFVATGIHQAGRNRPQALADGAALTTSQKLNETMTAKATGSGNVSAAEVAQMVFDAAAAGQFYIYSHPNRLKPLQDRMEDMVNRRNPTSTYAGAPDIEAQIKAALRA
jgi:NAD(P)-dependent dehydrogenase (short-subunit alcohol dehydrogenase family)